MKETALIFTGDIGFDKYMDKKWEDKELLSKEVRDFLGSGEHLIVNVEGPLSNMDKVNRAGGVSALLHSMDPEVAIFLNGLGADVWNICNNHIMDAGADDIIYTQIDCKYHHEVFYYLLSLCQIIFHDD